VVNSKQWQQIWYCEFFNTVDNGQAVEGFVDEMKSRRWIVMPRTRYKVKRIGFNGHKSCIGTEKIHHRVGERRNANTRAARNYAV